MCAFESEYRKITARIKPRQSAVKNVVWSKNFNRVAIVLKSSIIVGDKNFALLFQAKVTDSVLSGCFNDNDSFIYTTHNHLKYLISEDSQGIITTLPQPLYVVCVANSVFYYVDRNGALGNMKVDMNEYNYKMNVRRGRVGELSKQLARGEVVGTLAIKYLEQQGLPELALTYEKDDKSKFNLAIASGNLEVALIAAMEMKRKDSFAALANEAIKQGNFQIAEMCYQKMLAFDKLTFLYTLTGNLPKLEKIMNLAKNKLNDPMLQYQTALLTGDIPSQVKLLAEAGHLALAYVLAKKHGLTNLSSPLAEAIKENKKINQDLLNENAKVFTEEKTKRGVFGLRPLVRNGIGNNNWPIEELKPAKAAESAENVLEQKEEEGPKRERGDSLDDIITNEIEDSKAAPAAGREEEKVKIDITKGAWVGDDIIIADEPAAKTEEKTGEEAEEAEAATGGFVSPTHGTEFALTRIKGSLLSGLHCAVGEYETALRLLQKQIALVNPAPLKPVMMHVSGYSKVRLGLLSNASASELQLVDSQGRPVVPIKVGLLQAVHKVSFAERMCG